MYTVIVKYFYFSGVKFVQQIVYVNYRDIVQSNCSQLFLQTLMLSFPHLATTDEQVVNVPPLCSHLTTYRRHFYAEISYSHPFGILVRILTQIR